MKNIPEIELSDIKTKEQFGAFVTIEAVRFLIKQKAMLAPAIAEEVDFDRNEIQGLDEAFNYGRMDSIGQALNTSKSVVECVCWNDLSEDEQHNLRQNNKAVPSDKDVDILTAATLLKLASYDESDTGLWESLSPYRQISTKAYYTIENEVWWELEKIYKRVAGQFAGSSGEGLAFPERVEIAGGFIESVCEDVLDNVSMVGFPADDSGLAGELAMAREREAELVFALKSSGALAQAVIDKVGGLLTENKIRRVPGFEWHDATLASLTALVGVSLAAIENATQASVPMPTLMQFPSEDGGKWDFFAYVPNGVDAEAATNIVNQVIRDANLEQRKSDSGECADGLSVQEAIVQRLSQRGFVFPTEENGHYLHSYLWDQDTPDTVEQAKP